MTAKFGATSTTDDVLAGLDLKDKRVLVTGTSSGLGIESIIFIALRSSMLEGLFWIIAASLVVFGVVNVVAFATGLSWRKLPSLASRKEPA